MSNQLIQSAKHGKFRRWLRWACKMESSRGETASRGLCRQPRESTVVHRPAPHDIPDSRMKRDLAFSSSAISPASVHFCSLNTLSSTDITIRMVRWPWRSLLFGDANLNTAVLRSTSLHLLHWDQRQAAQVPTGHFTGQRSSSRHLYARTLLYHHTALRCNYFATMRRPQLPIPAPRNRLIRVPRARPDKQEDAWDITTRRRCLLEYGRIRGWASWPCSTFRPHELSSYPRRSYESASPSLPPNIHLREPSSPPAVCPYRMSWYTTYQLHVTTRRGCCMLVPRSLCVTLRR